ncbi:CubicO group peptidase (beta-lactamase class C family) [Saccharothrix carnea]|uniref:CubicO group peptidase (Beta-lactamase class C family) n=1 Tax=Saccharothrix carnea TaxID=1280637 RepID=A0A2P8HZI1_SACCR|nr:serine hydrolase domain-containing protein [Saccharothrix carnea]PSL51613.1 CubicO group peptidase (beta-lactamase class C family) [Saccharothrix carnea]
MFTLILSALIVSAGSLVPSTTAPPAVDGAAVDAVVAQYREQTAVPGVAVTVTRGDTVVHTAGYGRTPDGDAVSEHTTMAAASLSKSFTALAVVQLVEAGRVRLDDPVRAHLPEFTMADPRAADITVRQLLDQTSGLSDTTFRSFSGPAVHTLAEAVAAMRGSALASAPGTRWEYHNPNFQVAARLVEVVVGVPFADYLREHVFAPLGMDDSHTADTERDLPPTARGHVKVLGHPVALPEPPAFGNGSGGVLTSAHDLAAWLIAHNNGGLGPAGRSIATPQGITATHTPSAVSEYGLGWFVGRTASGAPLIDHGGDLFTSTAYQALLPGSGHGIAVLANTGLQYGDAKAIGERLIALVEGRQLPPVDDPYPVVDAVLLVLALAIGALAGRGVVRSRRWADRRQSGPWTVARLLPLVLPLLLAATVHRIVGFLYRGRDVAWLQVPYLYPTFMLALAVATLGGVAVLAARLLALSRRRATA